ncbi:hypothetical protein FACS1894217_09220 [Clostridia bacterium]|nr:hypothetical protein FACS1894217_09220 [Clostridia bacterium]
MNIAFEIQTGQALGVTRHVLNQLVALQDGACALLFCYLLARPEPLDMGQAEFTLGMPEPEVKRAFLKLRDAGLVGAAHAGSTPAPPPVHVALEEEPRPRERPTYDSRRISGVLKNDGSFRAVATDAESRLGKPLSPRDLQMLYSIYDWRGLSAGVISLLTTYCVEKYGPARVPTMNQIDREAAIWQDEGIDTETRAEEYLAELAERKTLRGEIISLLRIYGRTPSATEERYLKDWVGNFYSMELIALAYDKTVVRTGGMSWKYMDTILKSWRDKGLTTPQMVEEGDVKPTAAKAKPSTRPKNAKSYAVPAVSEGAGEHEKAAVEDMLNFLKRVKEENG